jgi:hypothetical protein
MRLTETQKEGIINALNQRTFYGGTNRCYPRMRDAVVNAIDQILERSEEMDHAKGDIYLDDSHINGGGHGLPNREKLFEKLAEILCDGDVTHWAKTQTGDPTERYQDALFMDFSWESPRKGRAYKFFTHSPEPSPGFSRIIDWHLRIDHIPSHHSDRPLDSAFDTGPLVASLHARILALEESARISPW